MLVGNRSRLPFPILLSLRSHMGRYRAMSIFTIIAIATSVALAAGLQMSTSSVQLELERTADALSGAAELEVTGGGSGISEDLLQIVLDTPGVKAASPLIQVTFHVRAADGSRHALRVLGVDFLSDTHVRGYRVERDEVEISDHVRLLSSLDSIIATREFVDRLGLKHGDKLNASTPFGDFQPILRGILAPGGVADAYSGQVGAMDIYSLQEVLGRRGTFDRIDVVRDADTELDEVRTALAAAIGPRATVRRPATRGEFADQVFGTISIGIWALTIVGIVVAAFLSYGTVSLSVDARMREFAVLRAVGMGTYQVRGLVWVDAAVLAMIGTAIGLTGGVFLARAFFRLLAQLSARMEPAQVASLELTPSVLGVSLVVGLFVSVAASIWPSIRATSRPPLDVLRQARGSPADTRIRWRSLAGPLALAAAVATAVAVAEIPALVQVGLVYLTGIVFVLALSKPLVLPLMRRAAPLWQRVLPSVGAFAGASLQARPFQAALTAAALTCIVGGLSGMSILLSSMEGSFYSWMQARYRDGLLVSAADPFIEHGNWVSPDNVKMIRSVPGTGPILESANTRVLISGDEVIVFARTMSVLETHGRLAVVNRDWPSVARDLQRGKIAVSEAFSRHFGKDVGDWLEVPHAAGSATFEIVALVRDYYGRGGTVHMDIASFDRYWTRRGSYSVVIWPERSEAELRSEIQSRALDDQVFFFTRSEDYARGAVRAFDQFTGLLYIVAVFTVGLGSLAAVTLMIGIVLDRRTELSNLRIAGATGWFLARLVVADGLLLGLYACFAGVLLGLFLSTPILGVLSEFLGWTLTHTVEPLPIVSVAGLVLLSALGAAAYPSLVARRVEQSLMAPPE